MMNFVIDQLKGDPPVARHGDTPRSGPVAGKLMSEYILDEEFSTLDVSMLDLARFEEERLIREYNVV